MSAPKLTIYRSSAGSGKTRTLAKEYLKLGLRYKAGYFRHILAVTFTNKATQEMKERIVQYLNDFSAGKGNSLAEELKAELKLTDAEFTQNCEQLRTEILHHYSQFSISTIDAFFQRVIRSFTRESGLAGDYRLEADNELVLSEVVNSLIDEVGQDEALTRWLVDFSRENLETDKPWDVRNGLVAFGNEVFREEFKRIENRFLQMPDQKKFLVNLGNELKKKKFFFINFVKGKAKEAMDLIHEVGLTIQDFKHGKNGSYAWFYKFSLIEAVAQMNEKAIGARARGEYHDPMEWPAPKSKNRNQVFTLAKEKLVPLLIEIVDFRDRFYRESLSAELVLRNFYEFGLLSDIVRKLRDYKAEHNLMLLADAPRFLNGVIADSETPFIYEKVGSFYKNYLIDEFQDTSRLQWENFKPLVAESLDSGNENFVVGDVKQAIYRWRGGDLTLLQQQLIDDFGKNLIREQELGHNFRSAKNIVHFNNLLFSQAASHVSAETDSALPSQVFGEVKQKVSSDEEGFVEIRFIETSDRHWREEALDHLVATMEMLQQQGVPLKDIAILTRTNDEGHQVVAHLLAHKNSEKAKRGFSYDVISNESLRMEGAASVNLILAALRYLHNTEDVVARAELAFENARLHRPEVSWEEVFRVSRQVTFEEFLPEAFGKNKIPLKKLPLYELIETLIQIFDLSARPGELPYLCAFQDIVLNFYTREHNNLQAFLEWWDDNRKKETTSLKTSGEIDAAQILTIHKAKGLQFNYVLIPFCSWEKEHGGYKSPTIWVESDESVFAGAGPIPVKYSSKLKDSYFAESYIIEKLFANLDNLNLLYVALTRAKKGLWVTAPHVKDKGENSGGKKIHHLMHDSILRAPDLQPYWDEKNQLVRLGKMEKSNKDTRQERPVFELKNYNVSRWRDKLVIRQAGSMFFGESQPEAVTKMVYGTHLHSILSRIHYAEDLDAAIASAIAEGLLTTDEVTVVHQELSRLLKRTEIKNWFSPEWTVRTEVPVLLPGGEESRIDRLVTRAGRAVVIDYKTGMPVKADQKQVQAYIDTLRKMNFTQVEGFIFYVRSGEVLEVKTGKARAAKRKADGQLELGLE